MKNIFTSLLCIASCISAFLSCSPKSAHKCYTLSGLDPSAFLDTTNPQKPVRLYTLKNASGMEVCITNFGGRIVSVMVPDKHGDMKDVVLGFDNLSDYRKIPTDFGATIGRYANRINKGRFVIDNDTIQLPQNNYGHCLHGGPTGWQYQTFQTTVHNDSVLKLVLESSDGDNNFPGNVTATVTYHLKQNNALDIVYSATTDKQTIINMTNHSYFNLSGDPTRPATDHVLYVKSDSITPIDSTFMTTGEMMAVKGTPFDFNIPKQLATEVNDFNNEQIKYGHGIDHNWVLKNKGDITQVAARLSSPQTGITLEVFTDEPGIQIYTGNFLNGEVKGKKDIAYPQRASVCLETQHYPDSPNKPQWPSVILSPGETYHSHCIFKFGVSK